MIIPGLAESAVAATAYTHLRPFAGLGMLGSVLGIQALIQGGCIPFICGIFALSSSSLMVAVWIATAESKAFWPSKWGIDFLHLDNPLVSGTILWILVASHSIDFFKRIKAIREGGRLFPDECRWKTLFADVQAMCHVLWPSCAFLPTHTVAGLPALQTEQNQIMNTRH